MGRERIAVFVVTVISGCDAASTTAMTVTSQQAATVDGTQPLSSFLRNARRIAAHPAPNIAPLGVAAAAKRNLPAIDTLIHFSGQFTSPGFDNDGNPQSVWPYTMVGRDPAQNRTTRFRAPIIPLIVELLDATGAVGKTATGAPLRQVTGADTLSLVLNSPVFEKFPFSNGNVQLTDGMMRAQFFHAGDRSRDGDGDRDDQGYHTVLQPVVVTARTVQLPFGTYRAIPKPDGTCCVAILAEANELVNHLFPPTADDTTSVLGAAEHAGDIRPADITTVLARDVVLFKGTLDNCCITGFHTVDVQPGTPANGNRERDFVMNFSSYSSDNFALPNVQDISTLAHEMEELFADPFVTNTTPWLLAIDPITLRSQCQNLLEVADVVEVMFQNQTYSATAHGRTYHPVNAALLSWFASESPSSARLGALSYPDETAITSLSPGPLLPDCVPH
jgi:hypothetical protein